MYYLTRINPARNEQRYYFLYVAPTLLGEHCIIRIHGRLGHHQHTLPPLIYPDATTAQRAVVILLQRRLKRGYLLQNCQPPAT